MVVLSSQVLLVVCGRGTTSHFTLLFFTSPICTGQPPFLRLSAVSSSPTLPIIPPVTQVCVTSQLTIVWSARVIVSQKCKAGNSPFPVDSLSNGFLAACDNCGSAMPAFTALLVGYIAALHGYAFCADILRSRVTNLSHANGDRGSRIRHKLAPEQRDTLSSRSISDTYKEFKYRNFHLRMERIPCLRCSRQGTPTGWTVHCIVRVQKLLSHDKPMEGPGDLDESIRSYAKTFHATLYCNPSFMAFSV